MKTHQWSGYWPTTEYPPDGARLRYQTRRRPEPRESTIVAVWCGIEPVIELANGETLFPGFDPFEVLPSVDAVDPGREVVPNG